MFQQLLYFLKRRQLQIPRLHFERFSGRLLLNCQTKLNRAVHYLLKWFSRLPHFFANQCRNIIINGECSSHIMMIICKAS
jgi:hypothetical protein